LDSGNGYLILLGFETVNFVSLESDPERIESRYFFVLFPLRVLDRSGSDFETLFGQFFHICLSNIVEGINIVSWKKRIYLFVLEFLGSESEIPYFK
jgi:hypothetical protein